jgi:hypothetical protein
MRLHMLRQIMHLVLPCQLSRLFDNGAKVYPSTRTETYHQGCQQGQHHLGASRVNLFFQAFSTIYFIGWDFSYLAGRRLELPRPLCYEMRAAELMRSAHRALDLAEHAAAAAGRPRAIADPGVLWQPFNRRRAAARAGAHPRRRIRAHARLHRDLQERHEPAQFDRRPARGVPAMLTLEYGLIGARALLAWLDSAIKRIRAGGYTLKPLSQLIGAAS